MKKRFIIPILFTIILFLSVTTVSAVDCSSYKKQVVCETNGCKWTAFTSKSGECVLDTSSNKAHVSCGNIYDIPKKVPELVSFFITVAQVATTVILILLGSIDLFKGITSQKEEEIKKGQQIFVKRLIAAALVFFVVLIVKLLVGAIAKSSSTNIIECIDCFISNNCNSNNKVYTSNTSDEKTTTTKTNLATKSTTKTTAKSNSSSNTKTKTKSKIKKNTLFIGDSRTVDMCENYKLCEKNDYIAKGSMGYDWFANTAISQINNKIKTKEYNIVILMGVNMSILDGKKEANKYFDKVSNLAKNTWKNQNIIFVSINPVYDSKTYYVKMKHVNEFNNTMKSKISSGKISNLSYCDTSSNLSLSASNYDSEGLHYDKQTYQKIYTTIKNNCLK